MRRFTPVQLRIAQALKQKPRQCGTELHKSTGVPLGTVYSTVKRMQVFDAVGSGRCDPQPGVGIPRVEYWLTWRGKAMLEAEDLYDSVIAEAKVKSLIRA